MSDPTPRAAAAPPAAASLTPLGVVNLTLRAVMEAGIVAGLAWWGYHTGTSTGARLVLMILAPAVGFGIWGAVDFHQAGSAGEWLRLIEELVISGLAALAVYAAGLRVAGIALAGVSLVHHGLVYVLGQRLLEGGPPTP